MTDPTTDEPEIDLLNEDDDSFEEAATGDAPSGDGEFEVFDVPDPLCGLVRGHVSEVKNNPNNKSQLIIEITSEEPDRKGTASCFINRTKPSLLQRLRAIATNLECDVKSHGKNGFYIEGDVKAMKNKSGLFVVDTFHKEDGSVSSSLAWGIPKDARSPEWKAYAAEQNFTAEQLAAIKASPGVIHPKHRALFE